MTTNSTSRRRFLRTAGAAAATGVTIGLAGCGGNNKVSHGWVSVDVPTDARLNDVSVTVNGPHAGGEGGTVLARHDDTWTEVVDSGPSGGSNAITGVDVTADGTRLWMGGDSGVAGYYDVSEDELVDTSAPKGKTSTWSDIAVSHRAGSERVYLVNSSGELLVGSFMGGEIRWGDTVKPGSGERVNSIAAIGDVAYICTDGGGVYRNDASTGDGVHGEWKTVGIRGDVASLMDISVTDEDHATVVTQEGQVLMYDGFRWLSLRKGQKALFAVDRDGRRGMAVGDAGTIVEIGDRDWRKVDTPTSNPLAGCALGTENYTDVAVGANGTILERFS